MSTYREMRSVFRLSSPLLLLLANYGTVYVHGRLARTQLRFTVFENSFAVRMLFFFKKDEKERGWKREKGKGGLGARKKETVRSQ